MLSRTTPSPAKSNPGASMNCQGYPPLQYDLYVLGLLNPAEAHIVHDHVESQCSACLSGVRRSSRLWGSFTAAPKDVEPASSVREQLHSINPPILTFPSRPGAEHHPWVPKWMQATLAVAGAVLLTLCGWYAGHTSGSIDHQRLITRVAQSEEELSSSKVQAQRQQQQTDRVRAALAAMGQTELVDEVTSLQSRLRQSEAEAAQYKALLERSGQRSDEKADLLVLLSSPHVRLIPLQSSLPASGTLAYALVVPDSKLAFVASDLAALPNGREYQLWLISGSGAKPSSAGVFVPDESGNAYVQVDEGQVISNPESLAVTEEPAGGSQSPTGVRVLTSSD